MWPVLFYRAVQPYILSERDFMQCCSSIGKITPANLYLFMPFFSMVKSSVINYKYFMCINVISIKRVTFFF